MSVTAPDVSYYRRTACGSSTAFGVFLVEPGTTYTAMQRRLVNFLARGATLVWLVETQDRTVTVYRREGPRCFGETEVLSGSDALPGFSCRVAELFT
jgi:Uma2 family endonuclease